ncbi:MAG TPA: glycoside hydrolase family 66 protein, partial [Acidimicrobiales bacterium]|nr:glycoside hydrolase family 66 protein [Acidimicrobiales bacterium]
EAYAPVYACDPTFAANCPELLLYRGDGQPEHLGELLAIADPGNFEWQRYWSTLYGEAADQIGFDGFHLDSYGYPRAALDASGAGVDMRAAYSAFLGAVRAARPAELMSFNQVNGVPARLQLPDGWGFRYVEAWPPNNAWRHLEGLLDRSDPRPGAPGGRGAIACYPPVWANDRPAALRTVTCTEAIVTSLGASLLVFGDRDGVLRDPYYPNYETLSRDEAATVLRWRRFALRCRDLFSEGEDTSWNEVGDENGAVVLTGAAPVYPEPLGQALFARVARHDGWVAVGVVDLTGSANGLWSEPTAAGRCRSVRVQVLLERPEQWSVTAAVLGASGDRFTPLSSQVVDHREGRAVEVELPLAAGWSVLRLRRPGHAAHGLTGPSARI